MATRQVGRPRRGVATLSRSRELLLIEDRGTRRRRRGRGAALLVRDVGLVEFTGRGPGGARSSGQDARPRSRRDTVCRAVIEDDAERWP